VLAKKKTITSGRKKGAIRKRKKNQGRPEDPTTQNPERKKHQKDRGGEEGKINTRLGENKVEIKRRV